MENKSQQELKFLRKQRQTASYMIEDFLINT